MKNGEVYLLDYWYMEGDSLFLKGYGEKLDINRKVVRKNEYNRDHISRNTPYSIPVDEVFILETNQVDKSLKSGVVMATMVTGAVTTMCIISPKTCFGSCPTFYASNNGSSAIMAEGFSASIMPGLEDIDVDHLMGTDYSKNYELTLTNEALETHSIRYANILAIEKLPEENVFQSREGTFFKTNHLISPNKCISPSGNCLVEIKKRDVLEYYSLSDPENLSSKEEITLSFPHVEGEQIGLVIGRRQTLMTTYLLYQGLAYMGNAVGYFMTQYELGNMAQKENIFDLLGGIEVYLKDGEGRWVMQSEIHETGPIAVDYSIIPLQSPLKGKIEIKIRMNKGLWRIGYLALTEIKKEVYPEVFQPVEVENQVGDEAGALVKLLDPEDYLVTFPGDRYVLKYQIPYEHAALFLESKGYYLEWIRESWIEEQDFKKLHQMIRKPGLYLKKIAPSYKNVEPEMENAFWNSRYVRP